MRLCRFRSPIFEAEGVGRRGDRRCFDKFMMARVMAGSVASPAGPGLVNGDLLRLFSPEPVSRRGYTAT